MSYVNKANKNGTEYDIQDARVPAPQEGDAGKVLKVSEALGFELGNAGGDTNVASKTDTFGKYIIQPNNVIHIPASITSSSNLQDIVDLNIGLEIPDAGSGVVEYYVMFENNVFSNSANMSSDTVYKIQFVPYGNKVVSFIAVTFDSDIESGISGICNYSFRTSSNVYDTTTPFSGYEFSKNVLLFGFERHSFEPSETRGVLIYERNQTGANSFSREYKWIDLPADYASKTYVLKSVNGSVQWVEEQA